MKVDVGCLRMLPSWELKILALYLSPKKTHFFSNKFTIFYLQDVLLLFHSIAEIHS